MRPSVVCGVPSWCAVRGVTNGNIYKRNDARHTDWPWRPSDRGEDRMEGHHNVGYCTPTLKTQLLIYVGEVTRNSFHNINKHDVVVPNYYLEMCLD